MCGSDFRSNVGPAVLPASPLTSGLEDRRITCGLRPHKRKPQVDAGAGNSLLASSRLSADSSA